ncbi:MAG: redoxin domain-containing protein [Bacteroidia bacterium]|nr:redoxin domain-containing protein [Bacteroidia bacterium]
MKIAILFLFFAPFVGFAQNRKSFEIGDTLPDFSYQGTFQKPYHLIELKGSYVLIHFWASWNPESRILQRDMAPSYLKYKDKKFKKARKFYIISISLDETKKLYELALKKDNLPWKAHECDFQGWQSPIIKKCKITSIPSNFLLNGEGIIIAKNRSAQDLEQLLRSY